MELLSQQLIHPLIIQRVFSNDKVFNLIQDTYLPAGTKQRGIAFFYQLKEAGYKEVVTYGTVYGYGQVATAWCCQEVGLLCTIFLPQTFPRTRMTKEALAFGANVIDVGPNGCYPNNTILSELAHNYALDDVNRRMIELGLDDAEFIQALADGISRASNGIKPKRIWVAGGSGVLSRALAKAFPGVELCIVQVGRYIDPDLLKDIKYTLYISPEPFRRNAEILPPYRSLYHYDAKIWRFVSLHGQSGDYIWNVK